MRSLNSILIIFSFFISQQVYSQLTGTKNIPGDYSDLASAIADLNTQGVGSGGVTLNLVSGNPQTAPAGGYVIGGSGSLVLTTSSSANPISILGNGNTITASAALTAGALNDAIFKFIGADWTSLIGFTMEENPANTTTAAATNNMTEWGVALLYVTTTDNATNITILNNTIDLNKTYQNTFGIYANATHSATAVTTTASATGANGGNHGLSIRRNTIQDVNNGIVVVGPTAAADQNTNIVIGGSMGVGNNVLNYGVTGTFSAYANVSGTVYGILIRNSKDYNLSYNQINCPGNTAGTLRGIYVPSASIAPTGTFTNTINNNTIALTYGVSSGTMQGITVEATNANATSIQNINNNNFTTLTASLTSSVAITAISSVAPHLTLSISGNTFTNISNNSTGSFTFFAHSYTMPANGTQTIDNNSIVTSFSKTGAGGSVIISTSGASSPNGSSHIFTNNNFSNISVTGATTITGISNTDGSGSSPNRQVTGNTFNNWTGGTSAITCMTYSYIGATSSFTSNSFTNITGQGSITGLNINSTFNGGAPLTISLNTINNLTSTGTGGTVIGIGCSNTSPNIIISDNSISSLSSTGASAVTGINITGAVNTTVSKNKICDLSGSNASSTVNGISVSSGTTVTLSNNRISGLQASIANAANPVNGINITGGTTISVSYNTVAISAISSGALFGSSAINVSTTPNVTLRNNIFLNSSTPNGAGFTVAYRRSTSTLTSYNAASNNNLLYAGTPGVSNLIFYDGTNSDQTLTAFKIRVAPRDAVSVTESVNFLTTSCASSDFLRINATLPTQIESGAVNISGITDDYAGDVRQGNPGYLGTGTSPDIGADEGNFTLADLTAPTITYLPLLVTCSTGNRTLNGVVIADPTGVSTGATRPRVYYNKNNGAWFSQPGTLSSGTGLNGTWDFTIVAADMGGLATGDLVYYYVIAEDIISPANVGAVPGLGLVASSTISVTVHPSNPNSFLIGNSIGGTYTVGSGGAYPTLTAAVNAYNTSCMSAPVIFELTDALYSGSETFPIIINQNPDASSVNTLTIRPATGVNAEISGAVASNAVISIRGRYIIIDGSNNNSSTRDLTISNTSTTSPNIITILSTGTNPVINNRVENCILINGVNSSSGVIVRGVDGLAGYFNDIAFENNSFRRSYYGVFINAFVTGTNGSGLVITGNDMNTVGADALRLAGIYVQGVNGATITNNNIGNITNSNGENPRGIWLATGTNNAVVSGNQIQNISLTNTGAFACAGIIISSGATTSDIVVNNNTISNLTNSGTLLNFGGILSLLTPNVDITNNTLNGLTQNATAAFWGIVSNGAVDCSISGNTISGLTTATTGITSALNVQGLSTNVNVFNNVVRDIRNTNASGSGSNGIQLSSTSTSANISVYNNMVSDVRSNGFAGAAAGNNGYGMIVTSGAGYNIYYNTVALNTNQAASGWPAALNVTSGVTDANAIDLRNNIFSNTQSVGTERYAIYSSAPNTVFSNINYNDYFTTGANLGFIGSNRATLTDIQTGFGGNANSVNIQPIFVSPTDLHLDPAPSTALNDLGTPIVGFTTDFDGNTRNVTTPDLGADEFTPPPCAVADGGTAMANDDGPFCLSGSTLISATGFSGGLGTTYLWQSASDLAFTTPVNIGSPSPSYSDLNTGTLSSTTYYRLKVNCANDMTEDFSAVTNPVEITNPQVLTTTGATRCGTGTVDLMATANLGETLNWYANPTGGAILGSGTTFTTPVINSTTNYYVASSSGFSNLNVASPTIGASTFITTSTGWGLRFTVAQTVNINTVTVSCSSTTPGASSIQIRITDLSDVVLYTGTLHNFTITSSLATYVIPVNISGVAPGNYKMVMTYTNITSMVRESTGVTFPYCTTGNEVCITAGANGTGTSQTTAAYYWFYNWVVSSGCEGARTAVTATVASPPALTLSSVAETICEGVNSNPVTISLGANDYDTYSWSPMTAVSGNENDGYVFNPLVTTTYTLTASQSTPPLCQNTAQIIITVNPAPAGSILPAAPVTINCGDIQELNAIIPSESKDYVFVATSGSFTPISGATNVDIIEDDDVHSAAIPIGFNFKFENVTYTDVYANSNGWLSFNSASGSATTAQWRTNATTAPATMLPLLAPLWDDLDGLDGPGQASYVTTGTAPNRVFTMEWLDWEWGWQADVPVISFQVKLYESTNKIEFIYNDEGGVTSLPTASVGIMTSAANYLMLDGTGINPMALNGTFNTGLSTKPASGQKYAFDPPTAVDYEWSGPAGTIFTNMAATILYTGQNISTVYVQPTTGGTNTYSVEIEGTNGCKKLINKDIEVNGCSIALNTKVFLSNVSGGTMDDYLRTLVGEFPLTDPYTTAPYSTSGLFTYVPAQTPATTTQTILDNNNVVDWVFVELRTGTSGSTTVTASKSGLLKNDGTIINPDGTPFSFSGVAAGNYFIAIKHRNHCGFMTDGTFVVPNPSLLNLTNGSVTLYEPNHPALKLQGGVYAMWTGDATGNGSVDGGDVNLIRPISGSIIDEYDPADVNLNGSVDGGDVNLTRANSGNVGNQID